jgi:Ca2+-binding RTX toxin-like protein
VTYYGTIIENVFTGMGNDIVIDNQVDNVIDTSAGDDYIYLGNGGLDTVNGGFGTDYVSFSYYESEMSIILNNDKYLVFNDNYMAILNNVEYIKFEDSLTYENIDLFV